MDNERRTPRGRLQPICNKCGGRHYGFVKCDKIAEFDERVKTKLRIESNKAYFEIHWKESPATWTRNDRIVSTGFYRNEFRSKNRWNTST